MPKATTPPVGLVSPLCTGSESPSTIMGGQWQAVLKDFPEKRLHRPHPCFSLRPLTRSARLLALWLAVCWLPLTMHCQLASLRSCCDDSACCEGQACGTNPGCCQGRASCGGASECHSGVCKIVESGNYFFETASKATPMACWGCGDSPAPMACRRLLPPVVNLTEATGAPPGWSRVWHFVFRAAPAPRAPSAVC